MTTYIHQQEDWPAFYWDHSRILQQLGEVRNHQGRIVGLMEMLGFELKQHAVLETMTLDVMKSSEIEGEKFERGQVRSSIARRLGIELSGAVASDRHVDGMVEMMIDATQQYREPLTKERLFGWHSALFPTGRSGMYPITVGIWRPDAKGPMQVVSGAMGKEMVHFEAPASNRLEGEMNEFIDWFNRNTPIDPVIKAAIAHLWFLTLHPFDDGNGRIARALTEMLLARSDDSPKRFYSMSARIRRERKKYYAILEISQKGSMDITLWILWFLESLRASLQMTESVLETILNKAGFWNRHSGMTFNDRQRTMLNRLLDGFRGKLTTSKWAKLSHCSTDTALRDIQDLIAKGILRQSASGGRSTDYELSGE